MQYQSITFLNMKALMIFFALFVLLQNQFTFAQSIDNSWIFKPEDKQLAEEKMSAFLSKADLSIADLLVEIGFSFLGTPYVAATLENGPDEKLVINLHELDCTTFAENCLAMSRTIKKGKSDFRSFAKELELIRYRDGKRDNYLSRLHYFSDWIHNNHEKKLISETPNQHGVRLDKKIDFMSTHAESYPVLKSNPELISTLKLQEKALTNKAYYYFPKTDQKNLLENLENGDIIGLTTSLNGLDITHVGIIIRKNKQFHLLHASQSGGKVVLSEGPITDFLKPESKNTGIIIARPIFE